MHKMAEFSRVVAITYITKSVQTVKDYETNCLRTCYHKCLKILNNMLLSTNHSSSAAGHLHINESQALHASYYGGEATGGAIKVINVKNTVFL